MRGSTTSAVALSPHTPRSPWISVSKGKGMAALAAERSAMTRALDLARRGPRGLNPQVGAIVLSPDGQVLAEGWHHGVGTPHAEVTALAELAPGAARGATMVVTLEPCNHTGHTGPCTEALIAAGVHRVVYAIDDPGAHSGGGAQRLRAAGVEVESGIEADAARQLLSSWLEVERLGRPHVTVKWAQSLDGRAAASDGSSRWITGAAAREDVHRRRALSDAIVVGTGTVLADDPALTARDGAGDLLDAQPLPVVIGTRPVPEDAALRTHPRGFVQFGDLPLFSETEPSVLGQLRERGVQSLFVEGGPTLASAFIRDGLVDTVLCYLAPTLIGGSATRDHPALADLGVSTISEQHRLALTDLIRLGDDLLLVATPEKH